MAFLVTDNYRSLFLTRIRKNARIFIGFCGSFIFYCVCIVVRWWHCWWETETSFVFFFVFLEGGGCRSYILSDLLTSSFTSCFPVWIKCLAMDTILYQYYANKQWFSSVALWFWVTTSSPDPGSQNRYAFPTKSLLVLVPNLDLVYCFCITKLKSWSWYGTLILIIPSISFIDCI